MFGCSSNKETFLEKTLSVPGPRIESGLFDTASEGGSQHICNSAQIHFKSIKDQDRKLKQRLNGG